jgi:hypothetical protein
METVEIDAIRKITVQRRIDHGRSQDISKQCEIQLIEELVRERRQDWNNNKSKMTPNRIVQIVRDNFPKARRDRGKPRKR